MLLSTTKIIENLLNFNTKALRNEGIDEKYKIQT